MKKLVGIFIFIFLLHPVVFSADTKTVSAGEYVSRVSIIKKYRDIAHNPIALSKLHEQAKKLSDKNK